MSDQLREQELKGFTSHARDIYWIEFADYDKNNPIIENLLIALQDYATYLEHKDKFENCTPHDFILLQRIAGKRRISDTNVKGEGTYKEPVETTLTNLLAATRLELKQTKSKLQKAIERYDRDVHGLNNEGDPIGGDPAGGYENDLRRANAEIERLKSLIGEHCGHIANITEAVNKDESGKACGAATAQRRD